MLPIAIRFAVLDTCIDRSTLVEVNQVDMDGDQVVEDGDRFVVNVDHEEQLGALTIVKIQFIHNNYPHMFFFY